jgi:hypothetical protein
MGTGSKESSKQNIHGPVSAFLRADPEAETRGVKKAGLQVQ